MSQHTKEEVTAILNLLDSNFYNAPHILMNVLQAIANTGTNADTFEDVAKTFARKSRQYTDKGFKKLWSMAVMLDKKDKFYKFDTLVAWLKICNYNGYLTLYPNNN